MILLRLISWPYARKHLLRCLLTIAGIVLGILGSFALQRFLASQLYGVSPTDPTVVVAVCVLMGAVALLAALLPARWASKIDPLDALRQ